MIDESRMKATKEILENLYAKAIIESMFEFKSAEDTNSAAQ